MNSLIESLNGLGEQFLRIAWPMLWQSTLLIALVFAVEFALRRKLRPAVRYALWLAVLIKLLLPPSLALPTSLAWWLRPGAAAPARTPAPTLVVTANVLPLPLPPPYYPAPAVRPKPEPMRTPMSPAAWVLIAWSCVSMGLLGWLAVRWQHVTGKVQRAARTPSPASGVTLQELFDEAKRAAGVRRVVRLRLVEQPISPAVYGLFHPVILLPQSLVERIAPEQLRAVLLHELIHFRRGDVWINCTQSLLQIVYWWHPLVWLANACIRRVREEAVDDAVMLALRGDAEHYAPALLEVAKLALNRPLATLGLVGILESRSALKHRVERLMNFTTPRRAGLTIVSVLGIAAFSALALPMGEAPAKPAVTIAQAYSRGHQEAPSPSHVSDEAGAEDHFELTSDHTTYYSPGEVTQARGNVVIKYHGMTFTADSAFVSRATGLLIARDAVFHRDKMFMTFGILSFNFKTGDLRTGDLNSDVSGTLPGIAIRVAAAGTYWMGTNSLDLTQLRVVLTAAGETMRGDSGKLSVQIQAADTASFGVIVQLLDLCKELGLTAISMRSAPENSSRPGNSASGSSFDEAYQKYFQRGIEEIKRSRAAAFAENPSTASETNVMHAASRTNLVFTSSGRQNILTKLDRLRLERFSCDGESLADVVRRVARETRAVDPENRGINIVISPGENTAPAGRPNIDPNTGLPVVAAGSSRDDVGSAIIHLKEPLTDARVAVVLDAIVKSADKPIKYSIRDYGIIFSAKSLAPELYMRTFKVDPNTFFMALQSFGALPVGMVGNSSGAVPTVPRVSMSGPGPTGTVTAGGNGLKFVTSTNSMAEEQSAFINFFLAIGVDLRPSTGKNIFYKDRQGILLVNATSQDLDIIEAALQTLNTSQPQINLKVKFVEVGPNALAPDSVLGDMLRPKLPARGSSDETNASAPFMLSGILTDPQYRKLLHELEQRAGSDVLGESQVTTLNGQQAQIQVTDERFVAAAIATAARASANGGGNTNTVIPSVIPSGFLTNTPIPLGPTVDLIPVLGADGFTIQLTVIPTLVDFIGYDDPGQMVVFVQGANSNSVSTPLTAQLPLPRFRVRQVTVNAIVWDGQTLVLSGPAPDDPRRTQDKVPVLGDLPVVGRLFRSETNAPPKKNLLIFVTPTLVDSAGNRVQSGQK